MLEQRRGLEMRDSECVQGSMSAIVGLEQEPGALRGCCSGGAPCLTLISAPQTAAGIEKEIKAVLK